MLNIDGHYGEGGGQILRTGLALAVVCGESVAIEGIRARRRRPGLQPQHLTAVRALASVCQGELEGDVLGATRLVFRPGEIRSGDYRFDVGTAGAASLVLQAILLPLALADGPSRVAIHGGTHVPWSPPAEYLAEVLFPVLDRMGIRAELVEVQAGLYPRGGGLLRVEVQGRAGLVPVTAVRPDGPWMIRGSVLVCGQPRRSGERAAERMRERLGSLGLEGPILVRESPARDAGMALFLAAEAGESRAGFSGLAGPDERSEAVVDRLVEDLGGFFRSGCGCDPHLADQLVLPMALASGTSRLTTTCVTSHLRASLEVVRRVLPCPIQLSGSDGQPGALTLQGGMPQAGVRSRRRRGDDSGGGGEIRPKFAAVSGGTEVQGGGGAGVSGESRVESPAPRTPDPGPRTTIRKARATDGPAIQRVLAHFATRGLLLPRTLDEVYRNLRDFSVAEVEGEVVGVCGLSLYWEDLAEVRSLAVLETQGSRGLGSALVEACVAEAAALGIRRVFALTYRQAFFERLGFRVLQKEELPQKIWKDCLGCAKFTCCDEIALIREASREP